MLIGLGLAAGGLGAGVFGSLLGLGGGILIVPLLTFVFGVPFRVAVGVSLVCVIVTSSAAAGVFLQRHVANLRLGMALEVFTATGALLGGLIAFALPTQLLAALFAALLLYTAATMFRAGRRTGPASTPPESAPAVIGDPAESAPAVIGDPADGRWVNVTSAGAAAPRATGAIADSASLPDGFLASLGGPGYAPHRYGAGAAGSLFAGVVSALLGVGGGIVKVPVMNLVMGVPLKAATATSNMMIGVTAAASAIVYLLHGGIDPLVAGPTAVGVYGGAMIGTRLAGRIDVGLLRMLFVAVMLVTAAEMISKALS
jgi:uncharacterized membrane protein YfcA